MESKELTPEERQTLRTYEATAEDWTRAHGQTDFCDQELSIFRSLLPTGRVFEVGCGGGRDAKRLLDFGYEYLGTDISPALLKVAKRLNPEATFLERSIYDLNLPQTGYDGFWTWAVLLHLPKNRIDQALQNLKKHLRLGGIGLISLKKGQGERMDDGYEGNQELRRYFVYYQAEEFADILVRNGFKVVRFLEHPMTAKTIWLCYFVSL